MVTKETVNILVDLLDGWQRLVLHEDQRVSFMDWLCAHTRMEFTPATFKENLSAWLSGIGDPRQFHADVLIIHSEILWLSKLENTQ